MGHKCLGIFLAVIFFFIFIICFLIFNAKIILFNVKFLKNEFQKNNLYSQTAEFIPIYLKDIAQKEENSEKRQESEEFAEITASAIKADWLKTETEKNLDNFFSWLYGRTKTINFEVSLVPLKGEFEKKFFSTIKESYNNLPECQSQNQFKINAGDLSQISFTCRPAGKSFEDIKKEMAKDQDFWATDEFPDVFKKEIDPHKTAFPGMAGYFSSPGAIYKFFNWTFYILLFLSVLILALITLMSKQSGRSLFRWLGVTLIVPSFLLFAGSLVWRLILGSNFNSWDCLKNQPGFQDSQFIFEFWASTIKTFGIDIANLKLLESGIIFSLALVLIIVSFFFKKVAITENQPK